MIFEEEKYEIGGREIILRSAMETEEEAQMLIDYLKTVCGETEFLLCYSDEVLYTAEGEISFIQDMNESNKKMLMLAFVDGEYAGNCSFTPAGAKRRVAHRAEFGIALFLKYTGFGLGRLMMERMIEKAKNMEYEQMELTVIEGNDRAYHLYESLGFKECGRIPKACKYDDGRYRDDIHMVLDLR